MNSLFKSLALGLASSALAFSAAASKGNDTTLEMGCLASTYKDAPAPEAFVVADGSRYWQADSLRVGDPDHASGVQLQKINATRAPHRTTALGDAALEGISSRVERLGQGFAATPLVHGIMNNSVGRPDQGGETKLPPLLLAAAAVVLFVARRRRFSL